MKNSDNSLMGLTLSDFDALRDAVDMPQPFRVILSPTLEMRTGFWWKRAILLLRWLWYKYVRRLDIIGFYAGIPVIRSENIVELGNDLIEIRG